mmetsp:Transcript_100348/g.197020  ORF Transcript_100348/g.197020 Transcript_100348/m.197020 type:complete len:641 (+) Transcript_100348:23-1945(+)
MLSGLLPAPKHRYETHQEEVEKDTPAAPAASSSSKKQIPSYPNRQGFVPLEVSDFGDGGAYPELHMVQYPLNMGRPGQRSSALVTVQVDETGKLRTDMIVKQGGNKNKLVQSQMSDIKEKEADIEKMALPEEKEIQDTAEKTRLALEALVQSKITSSKPSTAATTTEVAEANYIRYTPNPNAPGYNPAAKQRVIKMVEAQIDPLEPPKHKHTRAPRGPPSPPVPVLHSPPRKITVADQQAWKVPPCVSNWKNARGFIIPLDKRIAADGRNLQEVTINNKFATMSEALFIAERKATEDLKMRNDIRKKMALKEKEEREEALREMANRARMERAGIRTDDVSGAAGGGGGGRYADEQGSDEEDGRMEQRRDRFTGSAGGGRGGEASDLSDEDVEGFDGESEADKIARQQRERVRMERRKEREREIRLENMKGNMRKNKVDRDEGRDISEKIALGMLKGTGGKVTGESLYDSRLFNQSAGMDAGFGGEDEYNTYTKPLFDRAEAASIYRPKQSAEDMYGDAETQYKQLSDTSRFKADKGFRGTEQNGASGGKRDAPVQFERGDDGRDRRDDRDRRDPPRGDSHHTSSGGGGKDKAGDRDYYGPSSSSGSGRNSGGGRHRDEEEDPFGIRDIVDDSSRKRSRRD